MNWSDKIQVTNEDNMELMKRYPDNYFDLAIVDPPYNIKIDDWDNIKDYENYVRGLIKEVDRVLKRTGTMYFFGSMDWIATCKIIIDEFDMGLRSWIIWDKGAKQQNSTRSFADVTEHCLHFTKPKKEFDNNPVSEYLNKKRMQAGLSLADINRALGFATNGGGVASSYMGNKPTITIPSENHYNLLKDLLSLEKSRDELLSMDCKYTFNADDIRVKRNPNDKRKYKNEGQLCKNVFYNQNGQESGESDHPTAKPVDIIRTLIRASTNENDIILSPFLGSGTDVIAAHKENRMMVACELDKDYYEASHKRFKQVTSQTQLF